MRSVGDAPGRFVQYGEVAAVDLDAHLGPDTGRQHLNPIDDRHRPDVRDARKLRCCTELGAKPFDRHAGTPLVARLQGTTVSVMLSGDGSVDVSARPTLATAYSTGDLHERRVLTTRDLGVLLE